jgi:hypothetical protein
MRFAPSALLFTLVALAAGISGCGEPSVRMAEGPREYAPTDYELVLERWTREKDLIVTSQLDNVLTVTSTYESWDFRWAYTVRYAEDYRLTVDQRRALLERSLAESRKSHTFFVSLFAQKYKWSDLKLEEPAWIVRLIDDKGSETAPTDIDPIKKPGAIEKTYFPYTSPWRMSYRIRFPHTRADGRPTVAPNARWFGLRFAGPQGHQELVWLIDDEATRGTESVGG